jgi:hypothetical protein
MWYSKVVKDLSQLPDCMIHFDAELAEARQLDLTLRGKRLEQFSAEIPGIVEQRYNQLQEIEAILEYLNIELRRKKTAAFRKYMEHHDRALSSRDADKYAEGNEDVVDMAILINEFALLRNKWIGLHKALEAKNFQLNNIVKLRAAGIDDATI